MTIKKVILTEGNDSYQAEDSYRYQIDAKNGDDQVIGGLFNDTIDGGFGNDRIDGRDGNDLLLGKGGNDHLFGGDGNDQLQGDRDNDYLFGGNGEDVLFGAHLSSTTPGAGEIDVLTGGADCDRFILGIRQSEQSFYASNGNSDYALITDFTLNEDVIHLKGNLDEYQLLEHDYGFGSSAQDTGLYFGDELIAIMQDVTGLNLDVSSYSNGPFYALGYET